MAPLSIQILYALLGGIAPALLWLYFWLREDMHPEPKRLIAKAFLGGAVAIPFALAAEAVLYCAGAAAFGQDIRVPFCASSSAPLASFAGLFSPLTIALFALIEEYAKYKAARLRVLSGNDFDEPVDAMIYLITVALGFAAFENFFFLITAFGHGTTEGLVISNLRFLGATLLHAISSGIVGYSIALSFYHPENRTRFTAGGLLLGSLVHIAFNIAILHDRSATDPGNAPLFIVLLTGILLIFAFDRAKKIKKLSLIAS